MSIEKFVRHVQAVVKKAYDEQFPTLQTPAISYEEGSVYWRVVISSPGSRSVYGFVRRADGAIFKSASWKAPALKSGVRGFLDNYPDTLLTMHGIRYKDGGSYGPVVYPPRPE